MSIGVAWRLGNLVGYPCISSRATMGQTTVECEESSI